MVSNKKVRTWEGLNKTRVRFFKLHEVRNFVHSSIDSGVRPPDWKPQYLTFAGGKAHLEKQLIAHELARPEDIITIQTYERLSDVHNGREILDDLIQTKEKHLPEMKIWPYTFYSFSNSYKNIGCSYPSTSKNATWRQEPLIDLLDDLIAEPVKQFSVVDIDFCGIFNKTNADSVVNLFKNRVLAPSGLLFLTHQKGRDVRKGNLLRTLKGYLCNVPISGVKLIEDLDNKDKRYDIARYIMIPLYYTCKAYKFGYLMKYYQMIEYRDKNENSGLAVNMLQYFFRWERVESIENAEEELQQNLEVIRENSVRYHKWIS